MRQLGTILPNAASIAAGNDYYRRTQAEKRRVAHATGLDGLPSSLHGDETRYRVSDDVYAIVGSDGRIREFKQGDDGDRFIRFR